MNDVAKKPARGEVMIVAGEASGDLHGANLLRAMRRQAPELQFCGMGGRELAAAGMELLFDAASMGVVGITEVIGHLGAILRARRTLIERLRKQRPALLILIDYPDFNLWLAATAKELAIPVFYYISPQIWAWRRSRIHSLKQLTDRIAVILPFEQEFYARHGCAVDFVGHPLVDTVRPTMDRAEFVVRQGIDPARKLIGLLPGSRRKEVAALLPDFLAAALLLAGDRPQDYTFLIPQASTLTRADLDANGLADWHHGPDYRVISDDRYCMMAACDAVVAASGTVLLELAILGIPMVATYRTSRLTYLLGRLLIRHLDYFSLVNLIGGRAIIPELLQDAANPGQIAHELQLLLEDDQARTTLLAGLDAVRQQLGGPGAADRAATLALDILAKRRS